MALSYVSGTTIGNLRYYSLEVPLMIVSLAIIPAVDTARPHLAGFTEPPPPSAPRRSWIIRFGGGLFAVVVILGSVPLMVRSVQNPSEDLSDSNIRSVLHSAKYPMITSDQSQLVPYGRQISDYVASLNLRHGSVLVDTWQGFPIVVTSINMKTYVISSDLDFTACRCARRHQPPIPHVLADRRRIRPPRHHVPVVHLDLSRFPALSDRSTGEFFGSASVTHLAYLLVPIPVLRVVPSVHCDRPEEH